MKLHFISSILFSILLALLTLNPDIKARMIYMVAVLVIFYISLISFAVDYDKEKMKHLAKRRRELTKKSKSRKRKSKGKK